MHEVAHRVACLGLGLALSFAYAAGQPGSATVSTRKPLVIAHRGASALRPEHTLAAYEKAIDDGADFIEPDLVMTRDGVLVARHDNAIGATTDVSSHPEFADRRTTRVIDGERMTDWFIEDFAADEIATLRARERLPAMRGRKYDDRYGVPTFADIVALVERKARERGTPIGLIPEIKHSSHFHARDLDPERALVQAIAEHAYLHTAPLGVQSFEVGNLVRLRALLAGRPNVFLVQLVDADERVPVDRLLARETGHTYASMTTPSGLRVVAGYANVLAVNSRRVMPLDAHGQLDKPTSLIADAHAAGLAMHVWTLRPENAFLPPALRCGVDPDRRCESGSIAEIRAYLEAGVDGFFTDDPALGRRAVEQFLR